MIFFENFVKLIHDVAISRIDILIHKYIYSGKWTATDAGIGAGVDSYYEYLVKGAALLQRPELMKMFQKSRLASSAIYIWCFKKSPGQKTREMI